MIEKEATSACCRDNGSVATTSTSVCLGIAQYGVLLKKHNHNGLQRVGGGQGVLRRIGVGLGEGSRRGF